MARQHEFQNGECIHCTRPEKQKAMACRLPKGVAKPEPTYTAKVTPGLVAAIMGLSPSMKRAEALRIMVRKEIGQPDEFESNVVTDYNEGAKLMALDELNGFREVIESEDWFTRGPCAVKPTMIYDYDREEWGLLILRTPFGKRDGKPMEDANGIDHVWARTQFELLVTGLPWADVYQWSALEQRIDRMVLDQRFVETFDADLASFMELFKKGLKSTDEFIEPPVPVIETAESAIWAQQWEDMLEREQRVKDDKERLLEEARKMSGDRPASINGRRLIRSERSGSVAWTKLLAGEKIEVSAETKAKYTGAPTVSWSIK